MTENADADKKEKILNILSGKESINSTQIAAMLNTDAKEAERLLLDLRAKKLIENVVGDYYHLTYEGYRYLKQASFKRAL